MENIKDKKQLCKLVMTVNAQMAELEKEARNFGTSEKLHNSEIRLLNLIGRSKGASITELAESMGVTKGAISQNVRKLEKKGMVNKAIDKDNQSKMNIFLTSQGETACAYHRKYHEEFNGYVMNAMESCTEHEVKKIIEFFTKLEKNLSEFEG